MSEARVEREPDNIDILIVDEANQIVIAIENKVRAGLVSINWTVRDKGMGPVQRRMETGFCPSHQRRLRHGETSKLGLYDVLSGVRPRVAFSSPPF